MSFNKAEIFQLQERVKLMFNDPEFHKGSFIFIVLIMQLTNPFLASLYHNGKLSQH